MNEMKKRHAIELVVILIITLISFFIFTHYDFLEKIVQLSNKYEDYEIDEIISSCLAPIFHKENGGIFKNPL